MPTLKIGNLKINPPIIQGGMGVRVSMANLSAAVANEGGVGVIATAGIGAFEDFSGKAKADLAELIYTALRNEIKKARDKSDGIIGVNIMVALSDFDNLVKVSIDAGVDMIISGAGLPLNLPKFAEGKDIKLVPIVSSARTFKLICTRWMKRYNRLPDAVVIEGVKAGGHIGYAHQAIADGTAQTLEEIMAEVLPIANSFENPIPVIAAGGIYNGADIKHFLDLGASGVQMATRFVCTDECDVHENFKNAYIEAGPDDITIINSPVGLPGRVIRNKFVDRIKGGETAPFKCTYKCLRTCNPAQAPYCIAEVLAKAANGNTDESFCFAGENAYKCDEIIPVKTLIEKLQQEYAQAK